MLTREIVKTEKHARAVATLFVTIGAQDLVRRFEGMWLNPSADLGANELNELYRTTVAEFRNLCRTWGIDEAKALVVVQVETRTTQQVMEFDLVQTEGSRDEVTYDRAAEEKARAEY